MQKLFILSIFTLVLELTYQITILLDLEAYGVIAHLHTPNPPGN